MTNTDQRQPDEGPSESEETDDDSFDAVAFLTRVFNDIEDHGIAPNSRFAEGWLCPLYKKGDKREIANYRPITLLNSDYKLFTKTLAIKIADPAPSIIHPNQAGFVRGRSIADQIRLTQMIQSYAELDADGGGVIIGLDQEKAYDKIAHDYLWKTLARFKLPEKFINTVRSLYENANTAVMINGEMSSTYKITRGVRQGCPLSCLLFDIAIEPLAEMLRQSPLQGFKTKGMLERIIVTLFADDTTIYLSKNDDIQILLDIMKTWCSAAGAKFNISKTEVVPLGPEEYRVKIIMTRKLNETSREIPAGMNIAKEGEAKRFLGAWIGNNIDENGIWGPTLEKVTAALRRWESSFPTIEGRRIILQWTACGMTQYLANVQGMPVHVEKQLGKMCCEFAWDNSGNSLVNTETMKQDFTLGGKRVPNIKDRNDAIILAQVRDFLQSGDNEKPWTPFMKEILSKNAAKSPVTEARVRENPLIQDWNPVMTRLPKRIQKMLQTARTYNIRLDIAEVLPEQAREMPAWSHPAMTSEMRLLQNSFYSQFLRSRHKITTVGELEDFANSRKDHPNHRNTKTCRCEACEHKREHLDCGLSPAKCVEEANKLLKSIPAKWHPEHCRKAEKDRETPSHDQSKITKTMLWGGPIVEKFRVFGDKQKQRMITQLRRDRQEVADEDRIQVTIEAHGETHWKRNGSSINIAAAKKSTDPNEHTLVQLANTCESPSTADGAELTAAILALRETDSETEVKITFDSQDIYRMLTKDMAHLNCNGWETLKEAELYQALLAEIRHCAGSVTISRATNEDLKRKTKSALTSIDSHTEVDTDSLHEFKTTGMALESATQASLHRGVRAFRRVTERNETHNVLSRVTVDMNDMFKRYPEKEDIWKSIRNKDISKGARGFLWKNLHNAYRVGKNWKHITEDRVKCTLCGAEESMEHILLQCQESKANKTVWTLAKRLWELRESEWPEITYGTILGSGMPNFKRRGRITAKGRCRLFTILVTESAHLIWRIRCERLIKREDIPEKRHTRREITNKWLMVINTRIKLDNLYTNKKRFGKKAIRRELVDQTWQGVLKNNQDLPGSYAGQSGGLVGIELLRR